MSLVDRTGDNPTIPENVEKSKKIRKTRIVFVIIVALFIFGFFSTFFYIQSHTIYVDNPTGTGITFKIGDSIEESLEPFSHKKVNLSPGKYELIVDGENVGSFEKKYLDINSFLNPTQDIYIQEYIFYGYEEDSYEKYSYKLPNNHIEAYGNEADGPFLAHSGIYIKGDWDYNLDESVPSQVKLSKRSDYSIKSKIFRFDDFVKMYNETYADPSYSENGEYYDDEGMSGEILENSASGVTQYN